MRMRNLLLTLLVSLIAAPLAAQLQDGKIYRFINKANTNIAMEASSPTDIYGSAKSDRYSHLWLAEKHPNNSEAWSLRSLGNGLYVTPRGTSTIWTFSAKPSASTVLYCLSTGGNYYTLNSVNNATNSTCMHYATSQGGAIVGWNTGAEATHWTIEEVTIDEEELKKNWDELNKFNEVLTQESITKCETALANLFSDKACTTLKKNFANVAAVEADADYKALPAELQAMVKKVYTGDWAEANLDSSKPGWDSEHAKRFRIQSIEPYSIAGEVTDRFGINAHINMDNPTGMTGNYRQHVYIMVEGEIKDGAELYLGSLVGHGLLSTYENGTRLHEGLNVIPFHANGNTLYINYVVHTYQNGAYAHKLSDYKDLKVHIAGGNVNGYYNAVGDYLWGEPDDDDDWQYYEDRTNTESGTILGKRQILHFTMWPTNVSGEDGNYTEKNCMSLYLPNNIQVPASTPAKQKVNALIEAWDRIHLSELATMGLLSKAEMDSLNALYPRYNNKWEKAGNIYDYTDAMYANQSGVDYSEYFNHHGISRGNFSGYMSGGWRNCNYNQNTKNSIIGEIATSAGSTWGPAHEIGHQHQSVFTVNGLTEVTNNMHSNIAVWYMGLGTSRVNGTEGNLSVLYEKNYKNGRHFLFHAHDNGSQNLWTQTQMYYKLWMYYHLAGHKTDFFPTLFELNRRDRMSSNNLGWIDGKGHASGTASMLKYYKQACQAAGEDLTEFFRAHGFFFPLNQVERGDYSTSFYTQTQAEIDAAIAWVKAKGYKENLAPLFINDCVATPSYSHDGKTKRSYWDPETGNGKNATIGMYTTCMDKSVKAEGYLYNYSGTTLSILHKNASGAVGFIVYSNDELIAFTNNYTVNMPSVKGDIQVYAVQADGSKVQVLSAAEGGSEEEQRTALNSAINAAAKALSYVTTTGNEVGYYHEQSVKDLRALLDGAKNAYNNKDQSVKTYGQWAVALTNEINRISSDKYSMVNIKELNHFTLTNKSGALAYYNSGLKATSASQVPASSDDRRWEFVSTGNPDEFYIKNVGQNKYITNISNNQAATMTSTNVLSAAKFTVMYNGNGTLSFALTGDESTALNVAGDKSIIGWAASHSNSQWKVTVVADNASEVEREYLKDIMVEAQRTIDEIGTVEGDKVTFNSDVNVIADNTAALTVALNNLLQETEERLETAPNLLYYIDHLTAAIEALDGTYVLSPVASANNTITWYYIKDIANGTYCGVDTENKTAAKKMTVSNTEDIERENRDFWWGFEATGNEGEYKIFNAGQEVFIYNTKQNYMKVDGASDAAVFTITVDKENLGVVITQGTKYWNNGVAGNVSLKSTKSYWKLEKVTVEEGSFTGIEEIIESEGTKAIYDLTGRRINEITVPGIYIVNGKKVLVK
ncbi:MAG: M60 family metallopeptidase [Bacteroidaceae bacterium]|nr:M60 family metallopeptidase [Bacteroidaceae bacterium]